MTPPNRSPGANDTSSGGHDGAVAGGASGRHPGPGGTRQVLPQVDNRGPAWASWMQQDTVDWTVEMVSRAPGAPSFAVPPQRWGDAPVRRVGTLPTAEPDLQRTAHHHGSLGPAGHDATCAAALGMTLSQVLRTSQVPSAQRHLLPYLALCLHSGTIADVPLAAGLPYNQGHGLCFILGRVRLTPLRPSPNVMRWTQFASAIWWESRSVLSACCQCLRHSGPFSNSTPVPQISLSTILPQVGLGPRNTRECKRGAGQDPTDMPVLSCCTTPVQTIVHDIELNPGRLYFNLPRVFSCVQSKFWPDGPLYHPLGSIIHSNKRTYVSRNDGSRNRILPLRWPCHQAAFTGIDFELKCNRPGAEPTAQNSAGPVLLPASRFVLPAMGLHVVGPVGKKGTVCNYVQIPVEGQTVYSQFLA